MLCCHGRAPGCAFSKCCKVCTLQAHLQLAAAGSCGFGSHGDGGGAIDGPVQAVREEQARAVGAAAGQNADNLPGRARYLCRTGAGFCQWEQSNTLHPDKTPGKEHNISKCFAFRWSAGHGINDAVVA